MSGNFDDFADGLSQEVMREAAENFFGSRKRVEDETELFLQKAGELSKKGRRVLNRAGVFHALLLDGAKAVDFYCALGVEPGDLLKAEAHVAHECPLAPFSFSGKGRYIKLFCNEYELLQSNIADYLHGCIVDDPDLPGRKRQTVCLDMLTTWLANLNASVDACNECHAPSAVLEFSKNLDPTLRDHERITGGGVDNFACSLDQELKLHRVDRGELALPVLPELPPFAEVRDTVRDFARDLYQDHGQALGAIVKRVCSNLD